MKKNYKWYKGLLLLCCSLLLSFVAYSQSCPHLRGTAPVQYPYNGMGIDGDARTNFAFDPTVSCAFAGDWFLLPGDPSGPGEPIRDATTPPRFHPPHAGSIVEDTITWIDPFGVKDHTVFKTSTKLLDDPNTYKWWPLAGQKAPQKNDMNIVSVIFTRAETNMARLAPGTVVDSRIQQEDLAVIFTADRWSTDGDSYIDFEFLQKTLTLNPLGTMTSYADPFDEDGIPQGGRTKGDIDLTIEFHNGGVDATAQIDIWLPKEDSTGYTYVRQDSAKFSGIVFLSQNDSLLKILQPTFGGPDSLYQPNQVAEGVLMLGTILREFEVPVNICSEVATVWARTKTSGESQSAELKDFAGPWDVHVAPDPPEITCNEVVFPECSDQSEVEAVYEAWKLGDSITIIDSGTYDQDHPIQGFLPNGEFRELPSDASCEGFSTSYDFVFADYCGRTDTVTCTFVVTGVPDLLVNDPSGLWNSSCDFLDQVDVDTTFDNWRDDIYDALVSEVTGQRCHPQV
ncbi:MAG: hypothetical protein ACK5M7_16420 [Draconibacterium sp.]